MGVRVLSVSAVCTLLSLGFLHFGTRQFLHNLIDDRLIGPDFVETGNFRNAWKLLLSSKTMIVLCANFIINVFILLLVALKAIFFVELNTSETRKLLERLLNYIIYKGIFLPLVVPPTIVQAVIWSTWLAVLCSLKMFQALARDRLERMNASPSATPWTYFRVYSVLLMVICVDLLWINLCVMIYQSLGLFMNLLLFFEPLSIAFETLQALVVHGFQLLEIWLHHSEGESPTCHRSKLKDISTGGSLWEWKGLLIRNLGFFLDIMTLLMALGHYGYIWWLHGMSFHLVDAVLFLNIRALLSAIIKRIRGFVRLRIALGALHGALPDATSDELRKYDDECAICREPMAKAKKLSCNHLFHLTCLRSWLDQGLSDNYNCPTCRKPLNVGRPEGDVSPPAADVSTDEQLARQLSLGLNQRNATGRNLPQEGFPNQMPNPLENVAMRGEGLDSSWGHTWSGQGLDSAGPSSGLGSGGLGRVQMMMRQLAAVGETYAQTALDDTSWGLWPMDPSRAGTSSSSPLAPPASGSNVTVAGTGTGIRHRRAYSRTANDNLASILAMAETVREVLPHMPDELIFQDLQRTNSVTITVNNLLQM